MSQFSSRSDSVRPSAGAFVERPRHPGDAVELPDEVTPAVDLGEVPAWERRTAAQERAFERRRAEVLRQAAEQAQAAGRTEQGVLLEEVRRRQYESRKSWEAFQARARLDPQWAIQETERLRQERLREIEQYFGARAAAPSPARTGETPVVRAEAPAPVAPATVPGNGPQGEPVVRADTDRRDAGGTGTDQRDAGGTGTDQRDAGATSADRRDAGGTGTDRRDTGGTGELAAPVFLRLAATPPPPERPLKRAAPLLGKVAPLPAEEEWGVAPVSSPAGAGEWAGRWASLTTADDPLYVLLVGINALAELRLRWACPRPSPAILNAPVRPLELETLASWPTERLLARLGVEAEEVLRVMEAPLTGYLDWAREALEEFQRQVLGKRKERLKALIFVLRKRMQKRRTVRRVAELVTRLAWEAAGEAELPAPGRA